MAPLAYFWTFLELYKHIHLNRNFQGIKRGREVMIFNRIELNLTLKRKKLTKKRSFPTKAV